LRSVVIFGSSIRRATGKGAAPPAPRDPTPSEPDCPIKY
jgi:hypothetical protein